MSSHILILLCHLVPLYMQSLNVFLENYFKRILVLKGIFWEINTLVCNFFLCHIFILSHLPLFPILSPCLLSYFINIFLIHLLKYSHLSFPGELQTVLLENFIPLLFLLLFHVCSINSQETITWQESERQFCACDQGCHKELGRICKVLMNRVSLTYDSEMGQRVNIFAQGRQAKLKLC